LSDMSTTAIMLSGSHDDSKKMSRGAAEYSIRRSFRRAQSFHEIVMLVVMMLLLLAKPVKADAPVGDVTVNVTMPDAFLCGSGGTRPLTEFEMYMHDLGVPSWETECVQCAYDERCDKIYREAHTWYNRCVFEQDGPSRRVMEDFCVSEYVNVNTCKNVLAEAYGSLFAEFIMGRDNLKEVFQITAAVVAALLVLAVFALVKFCGKYRRLVVDHEGIKIKLVRYEKCFQQPYLERRDDDFYLEVPQINGEGREFKRLYAPRVVRMGFNAEQPPMEKPTLRQKESMDVKVDILSDREVKQKQPCGPEESKSGNFDLLLVDLVDSGEDDDTDSGSESGEDEEPVRSKSEKPLLTATVGKQESVKGADPPVKGSKATETHLDFDGKYKGGRMSESVLHGSIPTSMGRVADVLHLIVESSDGVLFYIGSGVSVAQGLMMTANHNIATIKALGVERVNKVGVYSWKESGKTGSFQKINDVVLDHCVPHEDLDLALIRVKRGLKTCLLTTPSENTHVVMFGNTKKSLVAKDINNLCVVATGYIMNISNGLLVHTVSTTKGDSGNPLFYGECCVAIHVGSRGNGVANEAVVMTTAVIDWVREHALDVRMRPLVSGAESWNIDEVLGALKLERSELKQSPYDSNEFFVTIGGFDVFIDTTARDRVYTAIMDGDQEIPIHPGELADMFGTRGTKKKGGGKKQIKHKMNVKKALTQQGRKAYGRNSKKNGLKRKIRNIMNNQRGKESIEFNDESPVEYAGSTSENEVDDEFPDCYLENCEVLASCNRRYYPAPLDLEGKVSATDFGLQEADVAVFCPPKLTEEEEIKSARRLLGVRDISPLEAGELKSFFQYLDLLFKRVPGEFAGEITLDEAWASVLADNHNKTPGVWFMDKNLSPCGGVHQEKKQVFGCECCRKFVAEVVGEIQRGEATHDVIFNCFLKKEITKRAKIDSNSQRIIFGGDLVFELVQRMVGLKTYKLMETFGTHNPIVMGVSLLWGGHRDVATRLLGLPKTEGDVKTMDLSITRTLMQVAMESWYHVTKTPSSNLSKYQLDILCNNKNIRLNDQIIRITDAARPGGGVNPSGNFLTTVINSFVSLFANWRAKRGVSIPILKRNRELAYMSGIIVSGDDFVVGDSDSKIIEKLHAGYQSCGLVLKDCKTNRGETYNFLGFHHYEDKGLKIRMAFPERTFLRLLYPLDKQTTEERASALRNYSIIFVNNPDFMSGLKKLCKEEGVEPFPEEFGRSILDGTESMRPDQGAKIVLPCDEEDSTDYRTESAPLAESVSSVSRGESKSYNNGESLGGPSSGPVVAFVGADGSSGGQTDKKDQAGSRASKRRKARAQRRASQWQPKGNEQQHIDRCAKSTSNHAQVEKDGEERKEKEKQGKERTGSDRVKAGPEGPVCAHH